MKIKHIFIASLTWFVFAFSAKAQSIADGLRFMEMEQFTRAGQVFITLANNSPTAENLYHLGNYYLRLELFDSAGGEKAELAKAQFEKGISADPKYAFNYVGLGAYHMFKGNRDAAKENFDKAIKLTKGKDADILFRLGEAYHIYPTKDYPQAIQLLEMAGRMKKNDPEIFLSLGDAYLIPNEGGRAADNYDRAIRIAPNSAKPYIRSGSLMIRAKNYNEALNKYKEGLAKDSLYGPGYRQLGELYYKAGKYENAVAAYRKYVNMSDQRPETMFRYGAFLFLSKNYKEAADVLNSIDSKNIYRYRLLGYCKAETSDFEKGFEYLSNFMSNVDSSKYLASDYEYLGKLNIESGKDTAAALALLSKAAQMDTNKISTIADYAKRFFDAKNYLAAAAVYQLLIDKGRTSAQDYYNLANAYFFGRNYEKADTVYNKLLELTPQSALANLFKARTINYRKLDPDQVKGLAKPYYEAFIEYGDKERLPKQYVEAYEYLMSYYYIQKKDINTAKEMASKIIELDAKNKKAQEMLGTAKK
jgi:tetratricopeptide (TPR) repeat protein